MSNQVMVWVFSILMLSAGVIVILLLAGIVSEHRKIIGIHHRVFDELSTWRDATLEVILWWHDQYEDGDGPPPAIRELERLHARHAGGIPDSDPQRQAEWIDALLDERYRMGADR